MNFYTAYRGEHDENHEGDVYARCGPVSFNVARQWVAGWLLPWLDDDGGEEANAVRALASLFAADEGPWEEMVWGDDYWIEIAS